MTATRLLAAFLLLISNLSAKADDRIRVEETADAILVETSALRAQIRKKGYVSGMAAGTFLDKKTGAIDLGFGLHIMDFLLAPGWRDDGYTRDLKFHGQLPKHYVEGPQICTQARELKPEVVQGKGFVAVTLRFQFTKPGAGYKAGSIWQQTLVFLPQKRYILSSETITSVNDHDELFYRIDMPGHVRHKDGDSFSHIYLSYQGDPLPSAAFRDDFAPDARYLYQRQEGRVPERMIRAYRVNVGGKPGPWLGGLTLDPAAVSEAWCHQRGYVCFIQELHRRKVKAGEPFGAAYVVGWFDDIEEMNRTCDLYKGKKTLVVREGTYLLKD